MTGRLRPQTDPVAKMSMIIAIEGLIPNRRHSPSVSQPAAPPLKGDMAGNYVVSS
jgi:hypothetical protein